MQSPNFHRQSYKRIIILSTEQSLKPYYANHTKDLIPTKSYSTCANTGHTHIFVVVHQKNILPTLVIPWTMFSKKADTQDKNGNRFILPHPYKMCPPIKYLKY